MSGDDRRTTPTGWRIRWNAQRAADAYAQGWWRRETMAEALRAAAIDDPDRILIVDGAVRVTAAGLARSAEAIAAALSARFAPGAVVSFMLPNWHEAAAIYAGVTLAGMVAHPILPSLRDHDLRFMLADAGSRMIFIPAAFRGHDHAGMLSRVIARLDDPPEVIVVRGDAGAHRPLDTLLAEATPPSARAAPDADDVRMVMYTSGTTGRPKGVLHTHNSINALIRQIGRHWLIAPGDRFLVPSPISHIGGSIYAFEAPVLLGTTAVLMESWDAAQAVALMQREGCTHMAGATPFLAQLLVAARAAGTRLPQLKVFICGGASVPPSLIHEASAYLDRAVVTRVYGSTEVPVTTVGALGRDDVGQAAATDGRPGIATVRLADEQEIRARGPQMLAGYIDVADDADAFDDDGFYRTGDQGAWTDDACLVVTGRIKDLVIRNGENIAPKEIEDLLVGHPDIAEVAIVGIPDPRTGERAVAVIVPRPGRTPDVATLAAFLEDAGVARFKFPERVALLDALPRNDAGKVLKPALRQRLAEA